MGMKCCIFIIVILLFLVGIATADLPDASTIVTNTQWVTANGVDRAKITVTVSNATSGPIKNALVQFDIDNPIYGFVSPLTDTSDNPGHAKSTFKVNKTSGVANITARISVDGYTVTRYITLNIDHDIPYYAYFSYPPSATVATEVPFNISLTDRWGNRIDDRRGPHKIGLHIHGPAPDDCSFIGYAHNIPGLTLDTNGNQSVLVRLTTKVGPNNIGMDAYGSIPDQLKWIDADTTGIPFSISQVYIPAGSPPTLPADGISKFTIVYSLLDRYGNPSNQQWVWVNTSVAGEENQFKTNNRGQITVMYGRRPSVGTINITATVVANSTVTISQMVKFTSTEATTMELTANPETMASRDVTPSTVTSDITATVTDVMGNPVGGETVTFSLGAVGYPGGPYTVTSLPWLSNNSSTTDADGVATVQFVPGSFSTNSSDVSYSPTASGNVVITATWKTFHKNLIVTWKNYPYLSVKTSVSPPVVAINDTVDVSIILKGDGWALGPKPIDVVMCTDRSGSMLYNDTDGIIDDRMVHAMDAAKIFNANMGTNDRVGLVSFGDNSATSGWAELRQGFSHQYSGAEWVGKDSTWTGDNSYITIHYSGNPRNYGTTQYASVDQNLSFTRTTVNNSINTMTPAGGTPMREGIYRSVKMLNDNPRANAVKAVILLTDGAWNTGGDPRGGAGSTSFTGVGTGSVITWAKNRNVTLYTIALGSDPSQTELQAYANETGGKFFAAPDANQLAGIYTTIAGDLKKEAGVNTSMMVDFQSTNVTGVPVPGIQVFKYVYHPTYSTRIGWQDGVVNVTDQSVDWADDHRLNFTIGTIEVGQSWSANFRLKTNQSGSIDIFGPNSRISFNGGTSSLTLPHTFLTVVAHLNMTDTEENSLEIENLLVTEPGEIKTTLPVMWNTSYTGNKTISEQVYYSIDKGPWVRFGALSHNYPYAPDISSATEYTDYAQLDVRKLPPGGYKIWVHATASDSPDGSAYTDVKIVGSAGKMIGRAHV